MGDWLDSLGLAQYENILIANGFDDMEFMGSDVIERDDLVQIGITDPEHLQLLTDAVKKLPRVKLIGKKH